MLKNYPRHIGIFSCRLRVLPDPPTYSLEPDLGWISACWGMPIAHGWISPSTDPEIPYTDRWIGGGSSTRLSRCRHCSIVQEPFGALGLIVFFGFVILPGG